jgi:hypothetical protein
MAMTVIAAVFDGKLEQQTAQETDNFKTSIVIDVYGAINIIDVYGV